jgi:tetratricopeptide (TPR) repeat protein
MLILLLCLLAEPAYVQNARAAIDFADHLYEKGEYQSAITEYKRVLFLVSFAQTEAGTPDSSDLVTYKPLNETPDTSPLVASETSDSSDREIDTSAVLLQIGRAHLWLNDYSVAFKYLERARSDTSYTLIGLSLLDEQDFASADKAFAKMEDQTWQSELSSHSSRLQSLPRKSPFFAGFASTLLPGSGRAYCGRLADGIFAFVFTVGSFALSYHYYDTDSRWGAAGFAGLGVFFHLGDIYGSIAAVRLHNQKSYYDELDKLKADFARFY